MEPKAPKPFKKYRIAFFCYFIMFLLGSGYVEFYLKLQTAYWEICKFIGLLILLFGAVLFKKIRDYESWATTIKTNLVLLLFLAIWSWQFFDNYKKDICMDKFGKEFNQRRRSLGIPVIPVDWQIDFRGNHSTDWKKKDTTGHYWKTTGVDSMCQITYEVDKYNFRPYHGVSRSMSSEYRFGNGESKDTVVFYYSAGETTKTITRHQADSIFAAEKIQKDY